MEKIRKGNDISILWEIMRGTEEVPYDLTGKDLTLYIKSMYKTEKVMDFTTDGNVLKWTFLGKNQSNTGVYSLTLVENEGKEDMHTVDECHAFELVNCSSKVGGDAESHVQIETISLKSAILLSAILPDKELDTNSTNVVENGAIAREFEATNKRIDELKVKHEEDITKAVKEVLGGASEAYDTLKEIEEYIEKDEAGAAALAESVAKNAKAIEAIAKEVKDLSAETETKLTELSEETRQVSHIANAIVENIELTPSTDNLIDTFSVAYLLPDSGKFYASTSVRSIYGKVKPNTLYTIDNKTTGNRFSVFTSKEKPAAGVDYTNRIDFAGLEQGTITTGASDNYMLIYLQSTDEDVDYSNYRIYEGVEFVKGKSKVDGLSEQVNELSELSALSPLIGKVEQGANLYDKSSARVGLFQGLTFYQIESYRYSAPIIVEAGKTYRQTILPELLPAATSYIRCQKDGTPIEALDIDITEEAWLYHIDFDGYILINAGYDNDVMFTLAEEWSDAYIPYGVVLQGVVIKGQTALEENPLYGKIIAFDGDSICAGVGNNGAYGKIIAERNSMTYQNQAVSGGTMLTNTYSSEGVARHWISTNVMNLRKDADYIIIEGGVNDAETMGAYSDSYSGDYDSTTFYGALDTMCKALYDHFGGKKVGFIIVHQVPLFKPDSLKVQAIKKVLAKWGIPYLDLNALCPPFGLLPSENSLRTTYTHNGDGWHPTIEGYERYYCDKIEAWLKTL